MRQKGTTVATTALAALLAASVAGVPGPASVTAADAEPGVCVNGWRSVVLPESAARTRPYEVVAQNGELAFVVGGADGSPLILRRTGSGWRSVDVTPKGKGIDKDAPVALLGASPADDGSLWAAGYVRPRRGVMEPYAGRLSGTRWRQRRVSGLRDARVALADAATKGPDRAWAVGTRLDKGRTRAYALRWDGSSWVRKDPNLKARESALTAVASTPGGAIWAVGWASATSGPKRPLMMRIGSGDWVRVPTPELPDGSAVLTDVEFRRTNDGWATGYLIPAGSSQHRPLVAHWDGETWEATVIDVAEDASAIPRSIALAEDGGIWLAGTLLPADSSDPRAFAASRAADGEWLLHDELPLPAGSSELYSVAATDGGAAVSGIAAGGKQAMVLETCDGTDDATATVAVTSSPSRGTEGNAAAHDWLLVSGERRLPAPVKPAGFRLRDVSAEVGLELDIHTLEGMVADLDADGWEDLFIWSHGDPHHVLLGGPDGFRPGQLDAFGRVDRHQCSTADVDADGSIDVFCSVGRARGSAIDRHELSLSPGYEGGGVEPDVLGIEDPFGRGRAATFIQLDDDGLPDLFVSNSPDRGDALPGTNRVYRNIGGRFAAAPEVGLDTSTGGWCAVAADIDQDGDEDLLHCQELTDDARDAGLRIHLNRDGVLTERSKRLGIKPIEDIDVLVEDMTGDGRPDIVQLSRTRLRVNKGTGNGRFKPVYEVLTPFGTGMAAGDANGDGAMDLYVVAGSTKGNEADMLLVNDGRGRSFTSVKVPRSDAGSGAAVLTLDHDHNGLDDFVVLDGRGGASGPVRLLASFAR